MEVFKKIRLCLVIVLAGVVLMSGCQEDGIFPKSKDTSLCTDCPPPHPRDPSCDDCD